jgi:3-keto-disaccharide hydrolase
VTPLPSPRLSTFALTALVLAFGIVQPIRGEEPAGKTINLFDGRTLEGWKVSDFAGHGEVHVEDGQVLLETGVALTGITCTRDIPRVDYEISLDAMRVDGDDFFCGLTFPVKDDPCSLIVGGWGGATVGLSSINGSDASENETTSHRSFTKGKWYHIRVRVTQKKIEAWIDKDQVVDLDHTERDLSIRIEVDASKPLGVASWCTTAALRNIKLQKLKDEGGRMKDEKEKR